MGERLLSVGLDVGTTSTQMILSELTVENRASEFSVPELEIAQRKIRYKSPVHFTPLVENSLVDGEKIRGLIESEYRQAGIRREDVDTGAIIITGETSRKENARVVLEALSEFAGDFVVATAGPGLESVLAAKGAGAAAYSAETGKTVLHMDIGGGTSNLALIRNGNIEKTGCLNVGGRLIKLQLDGMVTYVSPVLSGLCALEVGKQAPREEIEKVAVMLAQALEMAAGLRPRTALLEQLWTKESGDAWALEEDAVVSFSGGVADCIAKDVSWLEFGDMGPVLGQAIRRSALCRGEYRLGSETIRATVIGAGCYSTQLSGSTVFCQNVALPMKNLPVFLGLEAYRCREDAQTAVLALSGPEELSYREVAALAERIAESTGDREVLVCLEQDMAKALGQALALRLGSGARIMCLDRIRLGPESYLDVGMPVGPALPVVVKTLVLER